MKKHGHVHELRQLSAELIDVRELSYARDDRAQTLASSDYVNSLVQKAVDEGVPPEKIIVGGFSQGGVVALTAALRSDKKLVRGDGWAGFSSPFSFFCRRKVTRTKTLNVRCACTNRGESVTCREKKGVFIKKSLQVLFTVSTRVMIK